MSRATARQWSGCIASMVALALAVAAVSAMEDAAAVAVDGEVDGVPDDLITLPDPLSKALDQGKETQSQVASELPVLDVDAPELVRRARTWSVASITPLEPEVTYDIQDGMYPVVTRGKFLETVSPLPRPGKEEEEDDGVIAFRRSVAATPQEMGDAIADYQAATGARPATAGLSDLRVPLRRTNHLSADDFEASNPQGAAFPEDFTIKTVSWNLNHKQPRPEDVEELLREPVEAKDNVIVIGYQECIAGCIAPWNEEQRAQLRELCPSSVDAINNLAADVDLIACLHSRVLARKYVRVAHDQSGCCKEEQMRTFHGWTRLEVWVLKTTLDLEYLEGVRGALNPAPNAWDAAPWDYYRRAMEAAGWVQTSSVPLVLKPTVATPEGAAGELKYTYVPLSEARDSYVKVSKASVGAKIRIHRDLPSLCLVTAHFQSTRMNENKESRALMERNRGVEIVRDRIIDTAFGGTCGAVVLSGDLNYRLDFRVEKKKSLRYAEHGLESNGESGEVLSKFRTAVLQDVAVSVNQPAAAQGGETAMTKLFKDHDELHRMFYGTESQGPVPSGVTMKKLSSSSFMSGLIGVVGGHETKDSANAGLSTRCMTSVNPWAGYYLMPMDPNCAPTFCKNQGSKCNKAINTGFEEGLDECYMGNSVMNEMHGHILPAWTDRVLYSLAKFTTVENGAEANVKCPTGTVLTPPSKDKEDPPALTTLTISDHSPITAVLRLRKDPTGAGMPGFRSGRIAQGCPTAQDDTIPTLVRQKAMPRRRKSTPNPIKTQLGRAAAVLNLKKEYARVANDDSSVDYSSSDDEEAGRPPAPVWDRRGTDGDDDQAGIEMGNLGPLPRHGGVEDLPSAAKEAAYPDYD